MVIKIIQSNIVFVYLSQFIVANKHLRQHLSKYFKVYTTFVLMAGCGMFVQAEINIYTFERTQDEARFQHIITELRCPKCQNQNIADSNAPLSKDLKDRVYSMIKEGRSDSEIMNFMVERYGDFVLYRPPMKPLTYILWFGPFLIGLLIIIAIILIRKKTNKIYKSDNSLVSLSDDEQQALNILFSAKTKKDSENLNKD